MTLEGDTEVVADANAYQLEGPFTTFFVADGGHGKISGWSVRVASLRTDRIASIRRHVHDAHTIAEVGASTNGVNLRAV